jgi:hypothetical protein
MGEHPRILIKAIWRAIEDNADDNINEKSLQQIIFVKLLNNLLSAHAYLKYSNPYMPRSRTLDILKPFLSMSLQAIRSLHNEIAQTMAVSLLSNFLRSKPDYCASGATESLKLLWRAKLRSRDASRIVSDASHTRGPARKSELQVARDAWHYDFHTGWFNKFDPSAQSSCSFLSPSCHQ